jgi:hypothetical protein
MSLVLAQWLLLLVNGNRWRSRLCSLPAVAKAPRVFSRAYVVEKKSS